MSEDEEADISDRLEALAFKDENRIDIVKLLGEAPEMLRIHVQLPRMETKPYVEKYDWRERGKRLLEQT